jgi:hypothetical protein
MKRQELTREQLEALIRRVYAVDVIYWDVADDGEFRGCVCDDLAAFDREETPSQR